MSVFFYPTKRGYWGTGEEAENGANPTYYYDGQELLEVAVVVLPGNRNATKRGVEEIPDILSDIHDALGGKYQRSEIMKMKVSDVLDLLGDKRNLLDNKIENADSQGRISLALAALAMSK